MTARNILKQEKKASLTNALQNSNRHNVSINYFNINFDHEVSKIKDRTTAQSSRNPLIKILVKESMKQSASDSNVENTYTGTRPLTYSITG
jgi:glycerol-3-phosphate dehydrogenase